MLKTTDKPILFDRRLSVFICRQLWVGLFCACGLAQTTAGVGQGASSSPFQQQFLDAWERNGFRLLVGDPLGFVANYGSAGVVQQFPGVTNKNITLALIKPDMTGADNVFQLQAAMFAYYSTFSTATAGYPAADTANCPALLSPAYASNSCQWQPFTGDYALFVYAQATQSGSQNFATRDPFYTQWITLGGQSGIGPANSAETAVTSAYNSNATVQTFDQGEIFSITSGVLSGRLLAVTEPIYDFYVANGGSAGSLGLPSTEVLVLANGTRQQTFEGGAIQYSPSNGVPVLESPVASLTLSPSGSVHMNLGDTLGAQVTVYSATGQVLLDRTVTWSTSNGQAVQIQPNGLTATLKAVGAGTANVTVGSQGKTSSALIVTVTAPCCQIGEGAPTTAIGQAFQAAITRNNLSVQLPAASAVTSVGAGYVQQFVTTGATPVSFLVAVPANSSTGYVVAGLILAQYLALGGPAGPLGYPVTDATAGGRQAFQHGTLAGSPVQLVTGAILAEWASLGYETGTAGSPTAAAASFFTFRGSGGSIQSFQNALIVAPSVGPLSGQAFYVSGLVLAQYLASGGPGGNLGAPTDNEHTANGIRVQDFEGGSINYTPGSTAATIVIQPRQPLVTATPSTVISGTSVHLVAGGFANGATVRVSQTGQANFIVNVPTGAYAWDSLVPASSASGVITVSAADTNSSAAAQTTYTVRNFASAAITISIVQGDQQIGAPGAQLASPLVVVVQDQNGNPLPGQVVNFAASPGAQIVPPAATTGANGQASALLRLPAAAGIALATAATGTQLVTFSAKSAAVSIANFPVLTQAVSGTLGNGGGTILQQGALLTSVASILQYYQLQNQLPEPNGLADPITLNQFLSSFCVSDAQGNQICDGYISLGQSAEQTVNLWRVGAFVGGGLGVQIQPASLNSVRDLVSTGSPVLLALSMGSSGSQFVVATGVASDGSILIADSAFAQTNLSAYLNGFTAGGRSFQATLSGVVQLSPQVSGFSGFLVAASAPVSISSITGACGQTLQFPYIPFAPGAATISANLYFEACPGSAGPYQLDIGANGEYNATFSGLSTPGESIALSGSAPASYAIAGNGPQWASTPVTLNFTTSSVYNAASFTSAIAPGGLISIFGAGFVAAGSTTNVQVNGESATVIAALPFLVNAQVPFDIPPGAATLKVTSGNGTVQQPIVVSPVAPAIFSISASQAAITNQDNSLNSPSNPAGRGSYLVIYGTGFGAVTTSGGLSRANTALSAVIGGTTVPASFAGLTPGTIGLYQANVLVPASLPPGTSLGLYLQQGSSVSNTVTVAIR